MEPKQPCSIHAALKDQRDHRQRLVTLNHLKQLYERIAAEDEEERRLLEEPSAPGGSHNAEEEQLLPEPSNLQEKLLRALSKAGTFMQHGKKEKSSVVENIPPRSEEPLVVSDTASPQKSVTLNVAEDDDLSPKSSNAFARNVTFAQFSGSRSRLDKPKEEDDMPSAAAPVPHETSASKVELDADEYDSDDENIFESSDDESQAPTSTEQPRSRSMRLEGTALDEPVARMPESEAQKQMRRIRSRVFVKNGPGIVVGKSFAKGEGKPKGPERKPVLDPTTQHQQGAIATLAHIGIALSRLNKQKHKNNKRQEFTEDDEIAFNNFLAAAKKGDSKWMKDYIEDDEERLALRRELGATEGFTARGRVTIHTKGQTDSSSGKLKRTASLRKQKTAAFKDGKPEYLVDTTTANVLIEKLLTYKAPSLILSTYGQPCNHCGRQYDEYDKGPKKTEVEYTAADPKKVNEFLQARRAAGERRANPPRIELPANVPMELYRSLDRDMYDASIRMSFLSDEQVLETAVEKGFDIPPSEYTEEVSLEDDALSQEELAQKEKELQRRGKIRVEEVFDPRMMELVEAARAADAAIKKAEHCKLESGGEVEPAPFLFSYESTNDQVKVTESKVVESEDAVAPHGELSKSGRAPPAPEYTPAHVTPTLLHGDPLQMLDDNQNEREFDSLPILQQSEAGTSRPGTRANTGTPPATESEAGTAAPEEVPANTRTVHRSRTLAEQAHLLRKELLRKQLSDALDLGIWKDVRDHMAEEASRMRSTAASQGLRLAKQITQAKLELNSAKIQLKSLQRQLDFMSAEDRAGIIRLAKAETDLVNTERHINNLRKEKERLAEETAEKSEVVKYIQEKCEGWVVQHAQLNRMLSLTATQLRHRLPAKVDQLLSSTKLRVYLHLSKEQREEELKAVAAIKTSKRKRGQSTVQAAVKSPSPTKSPSPGLKSPSPTSERSDSPIGQKDEVLTRQEVLGDRCEDCGLFTGSTTYCIQTGRPHKPRTDYTLHVIMPIQTRFAPLAVRPGAKPEARTLIDPTANRFLYEARERRKQKLLKAESSRSKKRKKKSASQRSDELTLVIPGGDDNDFFSDSDDSVDEENLADQFIDADIEGDYCHLTDDGLLQPTEMFQFLFPRSTPSIVKTLAMKKSFLGFAKSIVDLIKSKLQDPETAAAEKEKKRKPPALKRLSFAGVGVQKQDDGASLFRQASSVPNLPPIQFSQSVSAGSNYFSMEGSMVMEASCINIPPQETLSFDTPEERRDYERAMERWQKAVSGLTATEAADKAASGPKTPMLGVANAKVTTDPELSEEFLHMLETMDDDEENLLLDFLTSVNGNDASREMLRAITGRNFDDVLNRIDEKLQRSGWHKKQKEKLRHIRQEAKEAEKDRAACAAAEAERVAADREAAAREANRPMPMPPYFQMLLRALMMIQSPDESSALAQVRNAMPPELIEMQDAVNSILTAANHASKKGHADHLQVAHLSEAQVLERYLQKEVTDLRDALKYVHTPVRDLLQRAAELEKDNGQLSEKLRLYVDRNAKDKEVLENLVQEHEKVKQQRQLQALTDGEPFEGGASDHPLSSSHVPRSPVPATTPTHSRTPTHARLTPPPTGLFGPHFSSLTSGAPTFSSLSPGAARSRSSSTKAQYEQFLSSSKRHSTQGKPAEEDDSTLVKHPISSNSVNLQQPSIVPKEKVEPVRGSKSVTPEVQSPGHQIVFSAVGERVVPHDSHRRSLDHNARSSLDGAKNSNPPSPQALPVSLKQPTTPQASSLTPQQRTPLQAPIVSIQLPVEFAFSSEPHQTPPPLVRHESIHRRRSEELSRSNSLHRSKNERQTPRASVDGAVEQKLKTSVDVTGIPEKAANDGSKVNQSPAEEERDRVKKTKKELAEAKKEKLENKRKELNEKLAKKSLELNSSEIRAKKKRSEDEREKIREALEKKKFKREEKDRKKKAKLLLLEEKRRQTRLAKLQALRKKAEMIKQREQKKRLREQEKKKKRMEKLERKKAREATRNIRLALGHDPGAEIQSSSSSDLSDALELDDMALTEEEKAMLRTFELRQKKARSSQDEERVFEDIIMSEDFVWIDETIELDNVNDAAKASADRQPQDGDDASEDDADDAEIAELERALKALDEEELSAEESEDDDMWSNDEELEEEEDEGDESPRSSLSGAVHKLQVNGGIVSFESSSGSIRLNAAGQRVDQKRKARKLKRTAAPKTDNAKSLRERAALEMRLLARVQREGNALDEEVKARNQEKASDSDSTPRSRVLDDEGGTAILDQSMSVSDVLRKRKEEGGRLRLGHSQSERSGRGIPNLTLRTHSLRAQQQNSEERPVNATLIDSEEPEFRSLEGSLRPRDSSSTLESPNQLSRTGGGMPDDIPFTAEELSQEDANGKGLSEDHVPLSSSKKIPRPPKAIRFDPTVVDQDEAKKSGSNSKRSEGAEKRPLQRQGSSASEMQLAAHKRRLEMAAKTAEETQRQLEQYQARQLERERGAMQRRRKSSVVDEPRVGLRKDSVVSKRKESVSQREETVRPQPVAISPLGKDQDEDTPHRVQSLSPLECTDTPCEEDMRGGGEVVSSLAVSTQSSIQGEEVQHVEDEQKPTTNRPSTPQHEPQDDDDPIMTLALQRIEEEMRRQENAMRGLSEEQLLAIMLVGEEERERTSRERISLATTASSASPKEPPKEPPTALKAPTPDPVASERSLSTVENVEAEKPREDCSVVAPSKSDAPLVLTKADLLKALEERRRREQRQKRELESEAQRREFERKLHMHQSAINDEINRTPTPPTGTGFGLAIGGLSFRKPSNKTKDRPRSDMVHAPPATSPTSTSLTPKASTSPTSSPAISPRSSQQPQPPKEGKQLLSLRDRAFQQTGATPSQPPLEAVQPMRGEADLRGSSVNRQASDPRQYAIETQANASLNLEISQKEASQTSPKASPLHQQKRHRGVAPLGKRAVAAQDTPPDEATPDLIPTQGTSSPIASPKANVLASTPRSPAVQRAAGKQLQGQIRRGRAVLKPQENGFLQLTIGAGSP